MHDKTLLRGCRCLQYVNEEHFALREFFCITCDPDQHKYMSMTDPDGDSASVFAGDYNRDNWGEIRICKHFAQRMWQSGSNDGKEYDMCGFSIFTDDHGVMPYGDVNPATGDDPILPSKYWTDNAKSEDGESLLPALATSRRAARLAAAALWPRIELPRTATSLTPLPPGFCRRFEDRRRRFWR